MQKTTALTILAFLAFAVICQAAGGCCANPTVAGEGPVVAIPQKRFDGVRDVIGALAGGTLGKAGYNLVVEKTNYPKHLQKLAKKNPALADATDFAAALGATGFGAYAGVKANRALIRRYRKPVVVVPTDEEGEAAPIVV